MFIKTTTRTSRRTAPALSLFSVASLLSAGLVSAYSKSQYSYNGLAQTPQMGWDNWNAFGCSVSASLLEQQAGLLLTLGLRDLGYVYAVLDDCWSSGRSANGTLVADPAKFPDGMAAVADKLHAMGLKFGMYSSAGKYTCGMYEGSLGHETVDAATFASWGVDYLKYDNCYNTGQAGTQQISAARYKAMSDALLATGRDIMYGLCNWGEDSPWNWGTTQSNSWRITGDIYDSFDRPDARCPCDGPDAFDCALPGFHCSTLNIANKASFVPSKAQPGGWNDLDMLTVGLGGQTDAEYVTHFSLWAAAKSPLISGADLSKISNSSLAIMSNAAVIAVNQDPLGSSAARRWYRTLANETNAWSRPSTQQMWAGNLNSTTGGTYNDAVVVLVNAAETPRAMSAPLAEIFVDDGTGGTAAQAGLAWEVRDLWGYRMSDAEAQAFLDGTAAAFNGTSYYYNATATPYAQGLADRNELLLGKVVGTVEAHGTLTATVDAHGAAMFRLRAVGSGSATRKRSEL